MWIVVVLVIVVVVILFREDFNNKNLSSEEILKKKFIEGEITEEDFISKMKVLKGSENDETNTKD